MEERDLGRRGVDSTTATTIKAINKGVIHKICSGQVILDLSAAVKELVENSLDAGATSIEISLKDYGQEWFQVVDNGCGISPHNFKVLAHKHHTSKLLDFSDLQTLTTFGFRGEALSSLCALGNLTVETRTKNESVATHLTFDHSGVLTGERKTARQIGTTVMVKNLFSNLPVRSKEFHRNIRKEYGKLITLLNAYAIISKRVRFVCSNTAGKHVKSVVLKTQGSDSLKDNIINVLGMNTYTCLEPISMTISESCKMEGFISRSGYGSGRNLGDRQYLFVNGRPVDMPKVNKLVNELYKGSNSNSRQYPIAIMNFEIPTKAFDVNVTPDKRKMFFSEEASILMSLREAIEKIYSPCRVIYSVTGLDEPRKSPHTPKLNPLEALELSSNESPPESVDHGRILYDKSGNLKGDNVCKVEIGNTCSKVIEESVYSNNGNSIRKDFTLHGMKKVDGFPARYIAPLTHENSNLRSDPYVVSSTFVEKDGTNAMKADGFSANHIVPLAHENSDSRSDPFVVSFTSVKNDGTNAMKKADGSSVRHNAQLAHENSYLQSDPSVVSSKFVEKDGTNASYGPSNFTQSSITNFITINKRKHENISTILSEVPVLRTTSHSAESNKRNHENVPTILSEVLIPTSHCAESNKRNHESTSTILSEVPILRNTSNSIESKKIIEKFSVSSGSLHRCQKVGGSTTIGKNEAFTHSKVEIGADTSRLPNTRGDTSVCGLDSSPMGGDAINTISKQDLAGMEITMCSSDAMSSSLSNKDRLNIPGNFSREASLIQSSEASIDSKNIASRVMGSTLQFSFKDLKTRRQQIRSRLQSKRHTAGTEKSKIYAASTLELSQPDNEERKARALAIATSELERLFKKEDFGRMKVIGQFNLGFIIGKLDKDLFILDQHAADEKYNFERLSQSTNLNQQPLLRPLLLELSPEEEVVASMHMDTIRKNGFHLEEDMHAPPGRHFKLKTVPFSKNITFGVEDVKELISTLVDSQGDCSMTGSYRLDTHDSLCPSRVRAMFASRACRSSVMIGDPLGRNEMKKILEHLVGLRSPWNCPHGRPTMRHLVDLSSVHKRYNPEDTDL